MNITTPAPKSMEKSARMAPSKSTLTLPHTTRFSVEMVARTHQRIEITGGVQAEAQNVQQENAEERKSAQHVEGFDTVGDGAWPRCTRSRYRGTACHRVVLRSATPAYTDYA